MSTPSRVEEIFLAALERGTPQERGAYLDEACRDDAELRRRVDRLLEAHPQAGSFLEKPALEHVEAVATVDQRGLPAHLAESAARAEAIQATPPPQGPTAGTKVRYVGDYELLEEIARGGMGVVYRARQVSLNRMVAIKMILAGELASAQDVQRFQREAEAAANLDHPNIVPIYEVGEHEGQHYFSMKLIYGTSLARRAASFGRDPKAAATLLAKVARAIDAAHQHGILHRDLKPGNILLDEAGEPFVVDFGLAKHVDGANWQTRTGAIVGTPSYMAPEQARSEKGLTGTVDVYSLGAILYEMLTGRPPFRSESDLDTILQVLDRDPPRPRSVNPDIDRDLETICLKCLEKDAQSRYKSARALAEDLERWLTGHTIQARSSGSATRALKWAKRNPAHAALLLVLAGWSTSVLFPAQSAKIEWGFCAVVIFFVLWRLVLVCGRATGKLLAPSVNWFLDLFWMADIVVAGLILCFYHGDLGDRKSLAFSVFVTLLILPDVFRWLRLRLRAGPLYAVLRHRRLKLLGLALFCMLIGNAMLILDVVLQQKGDLLVNVCHQIEISSLWIWSILVFAVGIEFREQGCVTFFRFIPWEKIASYGWSMPKNGVLRLRIELHNNPVFLQKDVDPGRKELFDRILREHLPPVGQPPVPPPKPPEWVVRITEQQQAKAPRRAFYDCLRKHRIPYLVASRSAGRFHGGFQVEIPLKERQRAQTIVDDLRHLGLVAELIEPVIGKEEKPNDSAGAR